GWQLELDTHSVGRTREEEFGLALALARKTLQRYVNRRGEDPPEGLTAAGFSLWLMEMDDGTAMGQRISE
ncbi:MAG: hypothetical protein V3R73_03560, partial [Sphingomonadales bacterium]